MVPFIYRHAILKVEDTYDTMTPRHLQKFMSINASVANEHLTVDAVGLGQADGTELFAGATLAAAILNLGLDSRPNLCLVDSSGRLQVGQQGIDSSRYAGDLTAKRTGDLQVADAVFQTTGTERMKALEVLGVGEFVHADGTVHFIPLFFRNVSHLQDSLYDFLKNLIHMNHVQFRRDWCSTVQR